MQFRILLLTFFIMMIFSVMQAQTDNYLVQKAAFSTDKYDEFSPVFFKKGVVFCTNRNAGIFSGYTTPDNKGFFKICYSDTSSSVSQESQLLQGDVNSHFNNGPATFSKGGDTIYFSRNLIVDGSFREISSNKNKLGIFYAVLAGGQWKVVTDMRFNDFSYNVTTPCLSPDGSKLYFASDRPDGYGGSDLYYCIWKNGYWDNPVNLGPVINTDGNEAYPFINENGELFFSSDKHPGLGGKDIFYSIFTDTAWITPVRLAAPINSKSDDFGFTADNTTSRGYFSSDRGNSVDIYSFRTIFPQFFHCTEQKDIHYCFSFADDGSTDIDPVQLQYEWDFGDGTKVRGYVAEHCFPGPGKYSVRQNIIDKRRNLLVFNKMFFDIELKEGALPSISSENVVVAGEPVKINAASTPGSTPLSYYWSFGDKSFGKGEQADHIFKEPGKYRINLAVNMKETATGKTRQVCVAKFLTVLNKGENKTTIGADSIKKIRGLEEVENEGYTSVRKRFSAKDELAEKAFFQVEVLSTGKKIETDDGIFDNIIPQYTVKMIFRPADSLYSYIIDEQPDFMSAYKAYDFAVTAGLKDARIITYVPKEAGERELWNFKRTNNILSDMLFAGKGTSLLPKGLPVLDKLVAILKRNPGLRILIAAHSDRTGSAAENLTITRKQAQSIADYFVSKGISRERLSATGYGGSRPIAPDYPESERRRNRRIDFVRTD